ncbi:Protein phosphatase 2C 1 [Puccinia graminis f. sp. tritici]|uniref:Protein phosphatase 2C 1 n=1 Tax=Puccinia graminis f. sp. tritici TaxID=56615 RepID=A0A5B0LRI0_PUCGR|nr:Protein phosphatase 2C 1 [Puccinia graminis f. sp. tritici]KAA1083832.1 Protein phosphatase 2C 1 [Puccinia graminis f. sp. tritici]
MAPPSEPESQSVQGKVDSTDNAEQHGQPEQREATPPPVQSPVATTHSAKEETGNAVSRRAPTSPDARSAEVTQLRAGENFVPGTINQHPPVGSSAGQAFKVGVSEDRNRKCRRTMEDSHSFLYSYGGVDGQGYFAVFDGHAGKHAAEWCGQWFHEYLLHELMNTPRTTPVPDLLNSTFHIVDTKLSQVAAEVGTHSGCTAVTAFLRLEYQNGEPVGSVGAGISDKAVTHVNLNDIVDQPWKHEAIALSEARDSTQKAAEQRKSSWDESRQSKGAIKRTLYTANVGDARAVLCRGTKAVRLTYDHKGSDQQEAQRITDAGGYVMNNRVNGVLAVTRSLGDSSMKEFVVGSPYTTETTLGPEDQFLIIACDGLWDVCEDQDAVDLILNVKDPQEASRVLLDHALSQFSTDNLSVMVISLRPVSFFDV